MCRLCFMLYYSFYVSHLEPCTVIMKLLFSEINPTFPGEDLVPEPTSEGEEDQQEEAPAAGLLHNHTHTTRRQHRRRWRRRWRRTPWGREQQRCYGYKQQWQQRSGFSIFFDSEHKGGVLMEGDNPALGPPFLQERRTSIRGTLTDARLSFSAGSVTFDL